MFWPVTQPRNTDIDGSYGQTRQSHQPHAPSQHVMNTFGHYQSLCIAHLYSRSRNERFRTLVSYKYRSAVRPLHVHPRTPPTLSWTVPL